MTDFKQPYYRSRKRETSKPIVAEWAWWQVTSSGVLTYTVPWQKATLSGQTVVEYMDDVVTPAFSYIKAKGGIVNSPMSRSVTEKTGSDAGWKIHLPGTTTIWGEGLNNFFAGGKNYPLHGPVGDDFPQSLSNLLTEMATQLRAKVNASTAQMQVSLGEMRETMRLLARPTQGLGRIIETAARMSSSGKFRGSSRNMSSLYQGLESLWLTNRYGWRPVMIDIEKFLQSYSESRWKLRDRVTVKRTLGSKGPRLSGSALVIGTGYTFSTVDQTEVTSEIVMGNYHELADFSLDDILGLRISDLPLSAWSLLPFSFVVDWFINVSQLLGTLTSFNTTTLAEWYVTKDVTKTVRLSGGGTVPAGWVIDRHPNAALTTTTTRYRRSPYLPASPGLALREESTRRFFQGDLRNLDALALLTTTFRTGRLPNLRGFR